jgi:hypothetical protein
LNLSVQEKTSNYDHIADTIGKANYATATREEMIARVPHKTDDEPNVEFQINSGKVFNALALDMREMVAWPNAMDVVPSQHHSTITAWD